MINRTFWSSRGKYILFLFSLFPAFLFATGASSVIAEMYPVSINDKGEILCRTRFILNNMGGSTNNNTEYGLCVLSNGKIIEFKTKELTFDEYTYWERERPHWDWVFKTNLNFDELSKQQKKICDKYGFKENNAEQYKVDKMYEISDFENEKNIDLKKQKQHALKNAWGIARINTKKVSVVYDFGNTLLLHNTYNSYDDNDTPIGIDFNYKNPCLPYYYEAHSITGVLFKTK